MLVHLTPASPLTRQVLPLKSSSSARALHAVGKISRSTLSYQAFIPLFSVLSPLREVHCRPHMESPISLLLSFPNAAQSSHHLLQEVLYPGAPFKNRLTAHPYPKSKVQSSHGTKSQQGRTESQYQNILICFLFYIATFFQDLAIDNHIHIHIQWLQSKESNL